MSSERNAESRFKAQKVLQKSEQHGRNEFSIEYDEMNPFRSVHIFFLVCLSASFSSPSTRLISLAKFLPFLFFIAWTASNSSPYTKMPHIPNALTVLRSIRLTRRANFA